MAGGAITGAWDQFAVNERLTGAKTDFDEELYTTKLNRGGADYRKREKEAERLAKEIMTVRWIDLSHCV
jgi:PAB1-binding protein PBP1